MSGSDFVPTTGLYALHPVIVELPEPNGRIGLALGLAMIAGLKLLESRRREGR
jgi:hypothetical protein